MQPTVTNITSVKNPVIRWAQGLSQASQRASEQLFLVEGDKLLGEALAAGLALHTLFVQEDRPLQPWLERCQPQAVYTLAPHVMQAMCDTKTPQGVAGAVALPQAGQLPLGKLFLLGERLQDPGNVGTLIRTADAAGADAVILSDDSADPFSPKVVRASMGSLFHLPVLRLPFSQALELLKAQGVFLMAGHLDGSDYYRRAPLPEKVGLMVGNESRGLSEQAAAQCNALYRLPIVRAESLNAAVAAAVMLFDVVREKQA